mgnify:FL=1
MSKRTLKSGQRIENARDISSVAYHDELSKVVREAFKNLPDAEVRRLVNLCSIGRSCIVEVPLSEIFEKEYVYDINNVISMSPLFKSIQRIDFLINEGFARIWLHGDIRKFLPKNHTLYRS